MTGFVGKWRKYIHRILSLYGNQSILPHLHFSFCRLQIAICFYQMINIAYVLAEFACLTLDPFTLKREVIPQHAMSSYGETRLPEPEHWEICESWL